jgi:hypothetical protein
MRRSFSSIASLSPLFGFVVLVAGAAGCASSTSAPSHVGSARVVTVYDDDILLTGITDAEQRASCAPAEPKHVVELPEASKSKVTLRATHGAAPLAGATLRVTHLGTKQTWCATMKGDAVTAVLPGQFPSGLYALQVSEGGEARRYEILWEQM